MGETKSKFRLRMNNHKLSIRNHIVTSLGIQWANHYNLRDHSITDLSCVILQEYFSSRKEPKIYEQKWALKLDSNNKGFNRDLAFLSHYSPFVKQESTLVRATLSVVSLKCRPIAIDEEGRGYRNIKPVSFTQFTTSCWQLLYCFGVLCC